LVYRIGGVQRSLAYAANDDVLTLDFGAKTLSLTRATYQPPQNVDAAGSGEILASTEGKVTNILVKVGDRVEKHQPLLVVEAMKMEHRHLADGDGEVVAIDVAEGQQVRNRQRLVKVMLNGEEVQS
jgi:geranyl-CoA carboxylase alpha subunit